jgi:cytochrome P450
MVLVGSSDPYELDLFDPELIVDPYRTYARLRANRGVHYRSPTGLCTVLSRYADVQLALTDPRFEPVNGDHGLTDQPSPADSLEQFRGTATCILQPLVACKSFDIVADYSRPLARGNLVCEIVISNGLLALLSHPDQLNLLRSPARLSASQVDELLRFETPVQRTLRKVAAEVELPEGDVIAQGELVTVLIGAANRDYQQFAEPDQLNLDRSNASRHLALLAQSGDSRGATRIRFEALVAINELLKACPDVHLGIDPPRRQASFSLRRLESVTVLNRARDCLLR